MPDDDTDAGQRKEKFRQKKESSDSYRSKSARGHRSPMLWKMAPTLALLFRQGLSTALLTDMQEGFATLPGNTISEAF